MSRSRPGRKGLKERSDLDAVPFEIPLETTFFWEGEDRGYPFLFNRLFSWPEVIESTRVPRSLSFSPWVFSLLDLSLSLEVILGNEKY